MRALLIVVAALGCGASPPPTCAPPENVQLLVEASPRINVDASGTALPTVVTIHQLKELGEVELAAFEELWPSPTESLGDTLSSSDDMTIYPGHRSVHPLRRDPEARYLLAVGVVRRPTGNSWRAIVDLPGPPVAHECERITAMGPDFIPPPAVLRFSLVGYRIETDAPLTHAAPASVPATTDSSPDLEPPSLPSSPSEPELPSIPSSPRAPSPSVASVPHL